MARRAAGAGGTLPVAEGHRCCPEGKAQSEGHGPVPLTAFLLLGGRRLVSRVSWENHEAPVPRLAENYKGCFIMFCPFPLAPYRQPIKRINSSGPLTWGLQRWAPRGLAAGGMGVWLSLPIASVDWTAWNHPFGGRGDRGGSGHREALTLLLSDRPLGPGNPRGK